MVLPTLLPHFTSFTSDFSQFSNLIIIKQNYFSLTDFLLLLNPSFSNSLLFGESLAASNASLVNYMLRTGDLSYFDNFENVQTTYHYSIPNIRLSYPEPFIAAPSFIHSDLWFVHILIFQY
jgi:hypothetical protein